MYIKQITVGLPDYGRVEALAKEAFPPEEYLAPAELIQMADRGEVDFLALYEGETFVGFTVVTLFENLAYLFFLAIDSGLRSGGYGSRVLKMLEECYPYRQHVVDLEMVDTAAANKEQRIRRKAFYLRGGYRETGKYLSYLGVDYEILCKDDRFDFDSFRRMLSTFRIEGFQPKYFTFCGKERVELCTN